MTIYKMQSIWDKLEETKFFLTEHKTYIHSSTSAVVLRKHGCSIVLGDWTSELKTKATPGECLLPADWLQAFFLSHLRNSHGQSAVWS